MAEKTNLKTCLVMVILLLGCYCTCALGDVIYVDANTPDNNDGSSWSKAYKYLQDALSAASEGTQIRVADGNYYPDADTADPCGTGKRGATFQLINGVALYGGYAGYGATDPNARDVELYETILSGDLNEDDEPNWVNYDENSYHVVTGSGTDANAVLDGFTITDANANGLNSPNERGGGMYNEGGSPTVVNCTFIANRAIRYGSGMSNFGGNPTVTNCTFTRNLADWAGGGMFDSNCSPKLTNCVFSENYGGNWGGGMHNDSSSPTLTNCTFSRNWVSSGGGGMYNDGGSPTLTNCTFIGNSVNSAPVSMHNVDNSESNDIGPLFLYPPGGGMYNFDSSPTLVNCTFSGNTADYGGGMANNVYSSPTLTNCTFSSNAATRYGGGIWINCESTPTVNNCILWADSAPTGAEIVIAGTDCPSIVTISYSDVQGGVAGVYVATGCTLNWGAGNINSDPLFVDATDNNLRLSPGSPCVDTGDPNYSDPNYPTDLNGYDRIIDGDCNDTDIVDMGAYEFLYSDIDRSGDVDFVDFSIFALQWLDTACGECSGADLTCDGNVNCDDLRELCHYWLAGK